MTAAITADRVLDGKLVATQMGYDMGNANLRKMLAERSIQVVVADNVADYVAANYQKGQRYEIGGFPTLAPPWNHAWIEYRNQGTERRGVYLIAFDLRKSTAEERAELTGFIGDAIDHAAEQSPGQQPRWAIGLITFVDDGRHVFGPIGAIILVLDEHGKELGNRWYASPDVKWQTLDEEQGMVLWRMVIPAMQTIAFSHCKNVVIERGERPPKLAKAYRKRHGREPMRWQTVRLELPRPARDNEEPTRPGTGPSLHIVAGHFSHYGDCCPTQHEPKGKLFGRLEGVYWMPQHLRGDPTREVKSDKVVALESRTDAGGVLIGAQQPQSGENP